MLDTPTYDIIIDAIFGFSFSGEIREPFKTIIYDLKEIQEKRATEIPMIISVDTPSGWDVEKGNVHETFTADMLVSLTAPKISAVYHSGAHYIGGRFIPKHICEKYNCSIP